MLKFSVSLQPVYHELAQNYETSQNCVFYQNIAKELCSPFEALVNEKVLDLACGTGLSTEVWLKHYSSFSWYAIDSSIKMLDIAKKKRA